MKFKLTSLFVLITLLQVSVAGAGNVTDEPGYLDLSWITIPDHAAEVQDIDLSDILKSMVIDTDNEEDASLAEAVAMIHSVRVKAFSLTPEDVDKAQKSVDKVMDKLKKDHWNRLVFVKDDDSTVTVNTKSDHGNIVGLIVVIFDPTDQAMFVNVAGDLNLGTLFKLAQNFGVTDLDALLDDSSSADSADAPEVDENQ